MGNECVKVIWKATTSQAKPFEKKQEREGKKRQVVSFKGIRVDTLEKHRVKGRGGKGKSSKHPKGGTGP